MRFFAALLFFGLISPSLVIAQTQQTQSIQCSGVVNCAQAMVATTDRLVRENAQLRQRLGEIERKLWSIDNAQTMRRGAVRVPGANRGYRETTIVFKPAFRSPPMVFLSARDVNILDHQQLWIKSISNDRVVIANCRRHNNPEKCSAYADDFHFDWIAVRR